MKTAGFTLLIVTAFALLSGLGTFAQQPVASGLPFIAGETLTFEAKISRIIKGIAVADLSFTVLNAPGGDDLIIRSEARSKGTMLKIFGFSFLQQFDSRIDSKGLHILRTVKHDVQKQRVRDSEAVFDYREKRVTYIETDPNDMTRPPRKIASAIEDVTHDMVSGVYALRNMDLKVGMTIEMKISDSGLIYTVPVRVTARELQKSIFGKIWCFRLEPDIFGPGRLIEREGKMTIWLMDDYRRLPIRSQINTEYGRIEVKLKTAASLK